MVDGETEATLLLVVGTGELTFERVERASIACGVKLLSMASW